MNAELKQFCEEAINLLTSAPRDEQVALFIKLKYDIFPRKFPHPIFSTQEAEMDFFKKTLDYLNHPETIKIDKDTLEFSKNYKEWLRKNA